MPSFRRGERRGRVGCGTGRVRENKGAAGGVGLNFIWRNGRTV